MTTHLSLAEATAFRVPRYLSTLAKFMHALNGPKQPPEHVAEEARKAYHAALTAIAVAQPAFKTHEELEAAEAAMKLAHEKHRFFVVLARWEDDTEF
ncbi:MAG: hypothetical protein AAFV36_05445 [Myxococcota bacterium]